MLEGGQLAKLRFPLPMGDDADPAWPSSMEAVFKGMHAQYQRHLSHVGAEPDQVDAQHLDVLTVEGRGHGR